MEDLVQLKIAAVAVYLASDDATFTTGTTISVDGGIQYN